MTQNSISYLQDHVSLGKRVGKPVYLGEYGASSPSSRSQFFPALHKAIQSSPEVAGSLVWEMQSRNNSQPCQVRLDNQGESLGMCVDSPGFELVVEHCKVLWNTFSAAVVGQRNVDHEHSHSTSSAALGIQSLHHMVCFVLAMSIILS
jgi:hypothetical protein